MNTETGYLILSIIPMICFIGIIIWSLIRNKGKKRVILDGIVFWVDGKCYEGVE